MALSSGRWRAGSGCERGAQNFSSRRISGNSFAAAAITGEKERKTYEMLLASPLRPGAIVLGKLVASLSHLAILIFASLPIVMTAVCCTSDPPCVLI